MRTIYIAMMLMLLGIISTYAELNPITQKTFSTYGT